MSAAAKLLATLLLAAALAAAAVVGLGSPAAASSEEPSTRPSYGETAALDSSDTALVVVGVLAGVLGAGLIGYALMPAPRAERVRVRDDLR